MSDKVRIVLHIDADAAGILDQTVTPRQKGAHISQLIRDAHNERGRANDLGILESIAASVRRIEKRLEGLG